jgi:hypothetical protein
MADSCDPLLRTLVTLFNSQGTKDVRMGLTLTVPGGVVSGALITEEAWLSEVAATIGSASYGTEDHLDALFDGWRQAAAGKNSEWNTAAKASEGMPTRYRQAIHDEHDDPYIHLGTARIWTSDREGGANAFPNHGMYWRGRVSSVSGWSVGVLHAPGYDTDGATDEAETDQDKGQR